MEVSCVLLIGKNGSYKLDEIIPDETEQDRITPIEVNLPEFGDIEPLKKGLINC